MATCDRCGDEISDPDFDYCNSCSNLIARLIRTATPPAVWKTYPKE